MTKDHWKALGGFGIITLLLLLCGLGAAAPAKATDPETPDVCVDIPATDPVGEEYIEVVDTQAWTETINHPAETTTVEHAAEYETDYLYVKQVKGYYQQQTGWFGWVNTGERFDWENWSGNSTRWEGPTFTESGSHDAIQSTDGKKRKVTTHYRYVQTGATQQGDLIKEAWTETITVKGPWTETIEHDATYKTIENPDYAPGTEGFTCPPVPEPTLYQVDDYAADCDGVITRASTVYTTPRDVWNGTEYVDGDTTSETTWTVVDASEVPEGSAVHQPIDCKEEPSPTPTEPTPTTPVEQPTTSTPTQPSTEPISTPEPTATAPVGSSSSPRPPTNGSSTPSVVSTQSPVQDGTRTELARTGVPTLPLALGALTLIGVGVWMKWRSKNA